MVRRVSETWERLRIMCGRRGLVIILVCSLELMLGSATLSAPPITFEMLPLLRAITPVAWGWIQIVLAIAALGFVTRQTGKDRFGFQLLFFPPAIWGLAYLSSVALGDWPLGVFNGIRAAVLWLGYAFMILVVSGMIGIEELKETDPSGSDSNG